SANHSATMNPAYGRRPADDAVMYNLARAWIGATAGTSQPVNADIAVQFRSAWLSHMDRGIGVLLADAQRGCVAVDRRDSIVYEYNLIGDADLPVYPPPRPLVGVESPMRALGFSIQPNPSNSEVLFDWTQAAAGHVRLEVYDVAGRRLATVAEQLFQAGRHSVRWRPTIGTGVYYVAFQSG